MGNNIKRMDRDGTHQAQFNKNKKKIYSTQDICGICGNQVDKTLRYPNPMSKCIDHIIPINKGGHPSDISNLQLAHLWCNRQKSDKLLANATQQTQQANQIVDNRDLPLTFKWTEYKG